MEFVIVKYPGEPRDVLVDEQVSGKTGETLQIQTGHHLFALGGEPDYTPQECFRKIADTNPIMPMEIEFKPKEGG